MPVDVAGQQNELHKVTGGGDGAVEAAAELLRVHNGKDHKGRSDSSERGVLQFVPVQLQLRQARSETGEVVLEPGEGEVRLPALLPDLVDQDGVASGFPVESEGADPEGQPADRDLFFAVD